MKVQSLRVFDNAGDARFPNIFENVPEEGAEDLVTLKLTKIEKKSDDYQGVDTEMFIKFGSMLAHWKPQSLGFLFKFLNTELVEAHKDGNTDSECESQMSDKMSEEEKQVIASRKELVKSEEEIARGISTTKHM